MKKTIIAAALASAMLMPYAAYAEPVTYELGGITLTEAPEAEEQETAVTEAAAAETTTEETVTEVQAENVQVSDAIGIDITLVPHQLVVDSTARFNLFNSDGELVATDEQWIGGDTRSVHLQFSVPPYIVGSEFTLGLADGLRSLKYYDSEIGVGGSFTLGTYAYEDEFGNILHGNNFAMEGDPNFTRAVNLYYDGKKAALWPPGQLIDGVGMISAYDLAKAMGIKAEYHAAYNSLTMSVGGKEIIFNLGGTYATFFGNDIFVSHEPIWCGDTIMVPARDVLDAFGCTIDLWQGEDHIDIIAGKSSVVTEYRNRERVNREGITSKTGYLIWVSKSSYQVKVYQGSRYNWECIRTAPCAIGAPGTPTIEGQFEFLYRGGTWTYPNFYVSPTMVFYGGYALHSTLKSYSGGMYDDRVGIQISHGCVRLHPDDINWMYAVIPIGTRVYVTP